jgi:hypothetical protein
LGGFVHGAYTITYYIYVNANAAHTYPYYICYCCFAWIGLD